jgi:DNA-directed RNA polymerase specialized sigma24 family protein
MDAEKLRLLEERLKLIKISKPKKPYKWVKKKRSGPKKKRGPKPKPGKPGRPRNKLKPGPKKKLGRPKKYKRPKVKKKPGPKPKPKTWRYYLTNKLPKQNELIKFMPMLKNMVKVARGESLVPKDIAFSYYKTINQQLCNNQKPGTSNPQLIIKTFNKLETLSAEDLEQQAYIYLLHLHKFYEKNWEAIRNRTISNRGGTFNDYVRQKVIRYLALYVSNEIKNKVADYYYKDENIDGMYELEEPETLEMNLGWLFVKEKGGLFKDLNVKQKYLIYLKYNQELSNKEIAEQTNVDEVTIRTFFKDVKDNTLKKAG